MLECRYCIKAINGKENVIIKKKVKKWQKVIAAIVLAAFLFQCGPVYALDQLPIDTSNLPAATETKEATENSTSAIAEEETEDASAGEETETSLGVEKKAENVSSIFDSASEYDSPEVLTDVLSGVETERENDKVLSSSTKHEIDGELEELREANVKYFLNTDKSITAATYPYDIHYLNDEGVYEEIDNSLVDGTDSDTGDAYDVIGTTVKERIELLSKDAERSFRFRYSTKDLVLTEEEGQIVLKDQTGKTVLVMEPLYMYDAAGAESSDVTYTLETIKDNRNNHEYILTVTAGSKWLDAEERVYPVTVDPTVTLKKENLNFYDAHVNSDSPNTNTNSTGTCTVGTNPYGTSYIYTKFTLPSDIKESDRIVSAELAFEPFTNDSASIFGTTVKAGPYLCAYETIADWNPSTITWNNKPAFGSDVIDYDKVDSNSRWYTWDITKILQGSGLGNKTYGVTLRSYNDESFSKRCYFYSSNSRYGSSTYPFVQVTYLNMKGLEDYWTYHSQSAGLAGTGYINDFTGNLTAVFEDFTVSSERLPMNVSHVYTGYNAGQHQSSLDVGSGFRLSIQESVAKKTIAGETKYLYTDGDGTEHYFEKDNAGNWVDDSGLDLKLTIDTSEYTITDKKDNKRVFSVASTYLKYIRDNKGNTLTLNYDGSNRLLSISDDSASKGASANRTITFNRQSGTNLLESMTYNGRTIYYSYTDTGNGYGSCLTQVTFPGGSTLSGWTSSSGSQVAKFVYTASGSLTDLIDATQNVGLHYGYLWQSGIRRVNEYSTCSYNGTTPILKNRYFIEYKQDHNIYTETAVSSGYPATGRWEKYYFNNMGQTISAQDQDGNALYSEQGIEGDSKNKVTFASKTQKTITNLLKNHSFENGLTGFSASSSSVAVVDGTKDYPALYGSKVLRMRATRAGCSATQTVSVRGGQSYTLSAYIRTTGAAYGFLELSCSSASATIKKHLLNRPEVISAMM